MVINEEIKKLAWSIWEAEGRPSGKHLDHYFRAKRMLDKSDRILSAISRAEKHPVGWERRGLNQRHEVLINEHDR